MPIFIHNYYIPTYQSNPLQTSNQKRKHSSILNLVLDTYIILNKEKV